MIDLARLHPARVGRGLRRRLVALVDRHLREPAEDEASVIVRMTLHQLADRGEAPSLAVTFTDRPVYRRDATYHRERNGYVLELPASERRSNVLRKSWELGPTYLYWLMQCPPEVEALSVTLSDGDAPSGARFSPSTNQTDIVPFPDPYFFRFNGFQRFRELAELNQATWSARSGEIVWRGASSGLGTFDPILGAQQPKLAAQRLELILAARLLPDVDVALSRYGRSEFSPALLERTGVLKQEIPEESWVNRKFAIDVDGQTNTWSNLFIRMLLGCCVLKLDSKYGYRQWYYDRLRPWEHFVPVKADASDLGEQLEWVRMNDGRAAEIAANGRRVVEALTFEAGCREAVDLISQHWRG